MPPVKCMNCMDAGFVQYDGVPRACGSCDAGRDYAANGGRKLTHAPRADANPMTLPPGGDVLITEMKRREAGVPAGVIGSDVVIQASLAELPMLHDLVRALDDLTRDVPGAAERAVEVLGGLPEWAIPDDVANRDNAPEPDDEDRPLTLVGAAPATTEHRRSRKSSAPKSTPPGAPLEPPVE